eukprot:2235465-Rhodomonas_salina.1
MDLALLLSLSFPAELPLRDPDDAHASIGALLIRAAHVSAPDALHPPLTRAALGERDEGALVVRTSCARARKAAGVRGVLGVDPGPAPLRWAV